MLIVRCDFSLFLLGVAEPVQKAETEWKTDQNQNRSKKLCKFQVSQYFSKSDAIEIIIFRFGTNEKNVRVSVFGEIFSLIKMAR